MTHQTLKSAATEIIKQTGIESEADQRVFRVNDGARHSFYDAMKIAKRVHGRTGYALIKLSRHDGNGVGIVEIGKSNTWLY